MPAYKPAKKGSSALKEILSRVSEESNWPEATGKGLVTGVIFTIMAAHNLSPDADKTKAIDMVKKLKVDIADRYIPWPELWAGI